MGCSYAYLLFIMYKNVAKYILGVSNYIEINCRRKAWVFQDDDHIKAAEDEDDDDEWAEAKLYNVRKT